MASPILQSVNDDDNDVDAEMSEDGELVDESSSDDGILFQRSTLGVPGSSTGRREGAPADEPFSEFGLLYQPGAILQCFEMAVASHDDPDPAALPRWSAPPTTVAPAASTSGGPQGSDDKASDSDHITTNASSNVGSGASILGDWKPRVLPWPDWMKDADDRSS
jgi:hypothetical protein